MEIKIVKNSHIYDGKYLMGDYVLETVNEESNYENISTLRLFLYDIVKNESKEISPNLPKFDIGGIYNVSTNKQNIYFLTGSTGEDSEFDFCLVKYDITTDTTEPVYSFSQNIKEYSYEYRLKMFILNDTCVLFQKEKYVTNTSNTYGGFFQYDLKLYNIVEDNMYAVADENLNKNGIDCMYSITDTVAIMKNGFSLLTDNRYNLLKKEEVSVESISYVNIGQLISDIMIGQNNISIDVIEQAYYNRTLPYIAVNDECVLYSAVNIETHEEEVVFYNYNTKERKNFINKNVVRMSDLAKIHIVNSTPYLIKNNKNNSCFTNLDTMKTDFEFDNNLTLRDVVNNMFILSGVHNKGIIRKTEVPFFEIYSSVPKKQLLLREKGEYLCSVYTDKDEIYIFEK